MEASVGGSPVVAAGDAQARTAAVAVVRFLEHCRSPRNLAGNTLRAYAGDLSHFVAHVGPGAAINSVDHSRIRDYARLLFEAGLKEATVRRRLATLKIFFRWLEREQLVPISAFHRLELSIRLPKRLPRALNSAEMQRLLRGARIRLGARRRRDRYDAIVMHFTLVALFTTGLRIGELVGAKLADVSVREGSIRVRGKGNRERYVYMPGKEAIAVLKRFADSRRKIAGTSEWLLVSNDGLPISAQHIRQKLKQLAVQCGIVRRVTPHMIRHTAATQLLEAGVDIRVVQRLLGHASIATTQIYTHVSDAALRLRLEQANTLKRLWRAGG